jgi:hypothetical protein
MKTLSLSLGVSLVFLFHVLSASAQNTEANNTEQFNLSDVQKIHFYGYDATLSKITDPKRSGQNLAGYMLELVANTSTQVTEKKMSNWLGLNNVDFHLNTTYESNKILNSEKLFYPNYSNRQEITRDSLRKIIENYEISEKEGTGLVIMYEFLSKDRKSVSGYGCFFDIKTKQIVLLASIEAKDGNSYRSFRDFWVPAIELVKKSCFEFKKLRTPPASLW